MLAAILCGVAVMMGGCFVDGAADTTESVQAVTCPPGCPSEDVHVHCDCVTGTCGDGVIDAGETCDTAIPSGPGACPTRATCDDEVACSSDVLVHAGTCRAECDHVPITRASDGDGCCPPGADARTDDDCAAVCGDGLVGVGETCDGNCPTSCDDHVACTADSLAGAGTCQAHCESTPITTPSDGDGCCPAGASPGNDSDC